VPYRAPATRAEKTECNSSYIRDKLPSDDAMVDGSGKWKVPKVLVRETREITMNPTPQHSGIYGTTRDRTYLLTKGQTVYEWNPTARTVA
jgi:hypothetical protein